MVAQSTIKKIIVAGLYLTLLLPLAFTSSTMYPSHFGKTIFFQVAVELLFVLACVYWYREKSALARLHPIDIAVLFFIVSQLASTYFGFDPNRSFWGYQSRAQGVFTWMHFALWYVLLRQFVRTAGEWRRFLTAALSVVVLSSVIAWVGRYTSFLGGIVPSGARLSGIIGNPIFFAGYLAPMAAIAGFFLWYFPLSRRRMYVLAATLFLLVMTFLGTQVRGAFLGFLGALFLLWAVGMCSSVYGKQRRLMLGAVGALCLFVSVCLYGVNQKSDIIRTSMPTVGRLLSVSLQENTAKTRLLAWGIGVQGWKERPIFGWGPENFQHVFDSHYKSAFLGFSFAETVWDKPHNYFVEVLVTQGAIGILTYLGMYAMAIVSLGRTVRRETSPRTYTGLLLLGAGLVMYAGHTFFSFDSSNSLYSFFLLLSLIAFATRDTVFFPAVSTGNYIPTKFFFLVMTAVAILLTPYTVYANYRQYAASAKMSVAYDAAAIGSVDQWNTHAFDIATYQVPFLWEQAILLTQGMSHLDVAKVLDKDTVEHIAPRLIHIFEQQIERTPDAYAPYFWLGEVYAFMAEKIDPVYFEHSNESLKTAWKISPEQQRIPLVLSKNYLLQGNISEAIVVLENLVATEPLFAEPHWFLGLALINIGKEEEGIFELEKGSSFGLAIRNNKLYLIDLYAKRKEYDKIIPLYESLISSEPTNAQWHARIAATHAALRNKEKVIEHINQAVALDPSLANEAKLFLQQQGLIQ